jgi:sugar phosphate isomerase/epimerase
MKFAICNETFQDWPFDKAFAFAAQCGYTGIEIAPFTMANNVKDIGSATRAEVRRQADAAGLEVVGLHWLLAQTRRSGAGLPSISAIWPNAAPIWAAR